MYNHLSISFPEELTVTDTLLATKFFIPPPQANLVRRQRLLDRLDESIRDGKRLLLISTPAGYGKTTLLGEWLQQSNYPKAWLSLDEGDNDPVKFITYLVYALEEISPGFGETTLTDTGSSQTQISNSQLTSMVNELVDFPEDTLIILDDYHSINKQTIHAAVSYLLENSPPQIHFIIASRADPPLPIARLRGRGQVAELRQNDLRFTLDEASEFLNKSQSVDLSDNDISALTTRTEGWAAGLQMASASLAEQIDVSAFIQEFTGSNRFILDYLIEEVLAIQPDTVQNFLLYTSILDQLCAPLCDHLLSGFIDLQSGSQAVLEELEHKNLFIIPLDDRREWYRFHSLFSDLLRQRLMLLFPGRKLSLHQRASEWYEEHGYPEEAIEHAFLAEENQRAANLIEEAAEGTLMQSQVTTLLSWIKMLEVKELQTRPALSIYYAWVLLWSGAPMEAIDAHMRLAASQQSHTAYALPLKAFLEIYNGNVQEAQELSLQALDQLPEENQLLRSLAYFILASCHLALGDTARGIEILEDTVRTSQQSGNVMIAALILCELGDETQKHGHLNQAKRLYEQALDLAKDKQGNQLPVAGKAYIGLGDLELEWNRLTSAEELLTKGIALAEQWSILGTFEGYLNLVMVKDAQGDRLTGDELLLQTHELAYQFDASEVDDYLVEMFAARRNIMRGDLDSAEQWIKLRALESNSTPPPGGENQNLLQTRMWKYEQAILARFLVAKGRYPEALSLLGKLSNEAEKIGRIYLKIDVEILRAIALDAQGNQQLSQEILSETLQLAEPESYMRVFLDHGNRLLRLLDAAVPGNNDPEIAEYIQQLINAFATPAENRSPARKVEEAALIEPLSDRESEVLNLLPSSLSSTEMASELSISVNTLRSHLKNIYAKLDAHSRYEAIARAKDAGLL
jgi:LuxR family maltose regulon positive regulatory protein